MNYTNGHRSIDNEDEPLFQFDLYERQPSPHNHIESTHALHPGLALSPFHENQFVEGVSGYGTSHTLSGSNNKGKAPSSNLRPIQIPQLSRTSPVHNYPVGDFALPAHGSSSDCLSCSLASSSASPSTSFGTFALKTPSDHADFMQSFANLGFDYGSNEVRGVILPSSSEVKEKGRAYIPPLSFSISPASCSHSQLSPLPPSSHSPEHDSATQPTKPQSPYQNVSPSQPPETHRPQYGIRSISPISLPDLDVPHGSACVPRFRKTSSRHAKGHSFLTKSLRTQPKGMGSQFVMTSPVYSGPLSARLTCSTPVTPRSASPGPPRNFRSYSSPRPFSAFDLVAHTNTDYFEPIPFVPCNHFEECLPRELQLQVLFSLIEIHVQEERALVSSDTWSCSRAGQRKHRWVGKSKAMRELVKLSRVSKTWRGLVYDGELWKDFELPSMAQVHPKSILAIGQQTGGLVKRLNMPSQTSLKGGVFVDLINSICVQPTPDQPYSHTQLTTVDLSCCRKLSTHSLHHLIVRCPSLRSLNVRGLNAVTNMTCTLISLHCTQLQNLDISRCAQLEAHALRSMANTVYESGQVLNLKRLVACGLKTINDDVMTMLGRVTPHLEVLDLSYTRIHNSAVEAFVAYQEGDGRTEAVVSLTPRQAGRDYGERDFYLRRRTQLRHINLSHCHLLTDDTCTSLAYTVPRLEFLELAGLGTGLKDDGLVHLLETTPLLRRLDIGGASSITDATIVTLTPHASDGDSLESLEDAMPVVPQLGDALEYLSISHAGSVSNGALLPLIRQCKRLRVLEADDTRISSTTMKVFIDLSRKRRMRNAKLVAVDCRGVSEALVKQLLPTIRPREGWRAYEARKLHYVDGRDGVVEDLKMCPDECDEERVVLKSFYSWGNVDDVAAARAERRKEHSRSGSPGDASPKSSRWWSRSSSGSSSPVVFFDGEREGCVVM